MTKQPRTVRDVLSTAFAELGIRIDTVTSIHFEANTSSDLIISTYAETAEGKRFTAKDPNELVGLATVLHSLSLDAEVSK